MQGTTHLFAGAAAGAALANTVAADDIKAAGIITLSAAVLALAPDIDVRGSKASNRTGLAGGVLRLFTEHRGFFHSPICYIILGAIAYAIAPDQLYAILAGVIGALTHIFLDCFNAYGCPLFYPIPKRIHFARVKPHGFTDIVLTVCFLIFLIFIAGDRFELWQKVLGMAGISF
ncbi:MAG: metal-dependent hydrolase [Firmicutes bacterium]|nr:metal-dependent hydrolase [Bacillota bacterium]